MEDDFRQSGKPDAGSDYEDGLDLQCDEMFADRRLSQIVAQILDTDSNIGVSDCPTDSDDESIITDFIEYNEEPKNKELFRDATRIIRTPGLLQEDELSNKASAERTYNSKDSTGVCKVVCDSITNVHVSASDNPMHVPTAGAYSQKSTKTERLCDTAVDKRLAYAVNTSSAGIVNIEKTSVDERLFNIDEDTDGSAGHVERHQAIERNDVFHTDKYSIHPADKQDTSFDGCERDSETLERPFTRWSVTSV